jgi:hypothetical protein
MMSKSDDCAGHGRCWSTPSCFSNHDRTVPAVWMGPLSSWKTASLFGYNVLIMGCTLITQPVHILSCNIQPWRVIMGSTEYCTTILLPKRSQNLHRVSLLEPGIPDCRLPWVFSKYSSWCREQRGGRLIWPHHARFHSYIFQILWSWHRRLRIRALISVIRCFEIAALPWMLDLWNSRRTVLVETGSSRWIFLSSVVQ